MKEISTHVLKTVATEIKKHLTFTLRYLVLWFFTLWMKQTTWKHKLTSVVKI